MLRSKLSLFSIKKKTRGKFKRERERERDSYIIAILSFTKTKSLFGRGVWVILFIVFWNTCGWKSM